MSARIAAGLALVPAGVCASVGALLGPADVGWGPLWGSLAVVYVLVAAALWREHPASRPAGLALALGGLVCSAQGWVVAGPSPLMIGGVAGHALWSMAVLLTPRRLSRRQASAIFLASASVPCAIIYGLAPQQDLAAMLGMLAGAMLVLGSAVGISRGRTWGLLLAPVGAIAICTTVAGAPQCGCLADAHPMLPQAGLAVMAMGVAAAVLSTVAFAVYVAPIVRFLRNR